ncbi:hypothetical protein MPSEU_000383700 [Mayamaea pseudoterrestris]|nr:hypothetical protein MPSEU_000383700 [Mayamaea pseudoterrestris]
MRSTIRRTSYLTALTFILLTPCLAFSSYAFSVQARRHEKYHPRIADGPSNSIAADNRRQFFQKSAPILLSGFSIPHKSMALTPKQAETDYDTYASEYDVLDGGSAASFLGIDQARIQLLKQARGKVMEIGVGTGLNLGYYDASAVTSLTLVDVSSNMLQAARARVESLPQLRNIPVTFIKADATSELVKAFGEASFDTVIDTFSLCVMGSQGARQCLEQISKVVKPQGKVLLLENSRSNNALLGLYQDATADAAAIGGKGCVYNQDVDAMLRESSLEVPSTRLYAAGLFRSYECRRTQS